MQSTHSAFRAGLAEPDWSKSDEAPGVAAEGFRDQEEQDSGDFQASGAADQAALVIEGEAFMSAYMERVHAGLAHPGELAVLLLFLSGSMLQAACRVIEKALEGQHHA